MVVYDYDSSVILIKAMENRQNTINRKCIWNIIQQPRNQSFKPRFQKLDNKSSNILIQSLQVKNIVFQLVPSNMHQRNAF